MRLRLPTAAVLSILCATLAQASTWPIEKGSPEYRHISDAIQILKDAGGDPKKSPSPAWLANNIQTYLNQGKIKARLGDSVYGSNTAYGGDVYVHFGKFQATGGGWDPNSDSGFKNLIILASTIAHEKFHSENHGDILRVIWTGSYESAAYLHEIDFLDRLAKAISDACDAIPNNQAEDKLKCLRRLLVVYKTKQDLIRVYNASQFARAGTPVPDVTVETIDGVVEQLEFIIPVWEVHAEDISDSPPDQLDDLLAAFDAQLGPATASFHADVQCSEAQILSRLGDQRSALAARTAARADAAADSIAAAIRALSDTDGAPNTTTLLLVQASDGLLTEAGVYYSALADQAGEGRFLHVQDLRAKPDAVLEVGEEALRELVDAADPVATAQRLQEEGKLLVRAWGSKD